ncbi:hypothetical protein F9B85_13580 [Heliorestis acidaminivorans]|uniref:Uncharacterized protein n=1 Tax=Heliorestis acidaminivorans TaxID=553427 RepID=A0A6I0EVS7_9FIRM|nr:hypothetical protein [Heliorestis acidaminivorans]KAB2951035.1 hypothetical protein F9B85_13580 [Heliorestis acidaminivorans]
MREFWKRLFQRKPSVLRDLLPEKFYDYIEQSHVHLGYEAVLLRLPNGHLIQISYRLASPSHSPFTVTLGNWKYKKFPKPTTCALESHFDDTLELSALECVAFLHQIEALPCKDSGANYIPAEMLKGNGFEKLAKIS